MSNQSKGAAGQCSVVGASAARCDVSTQSTLSRASLPYHTLFSHDHVALLLQVLVTRVTCLAMPLMRPRR